MPEPISEMMPEYRAKLARKYAPGGAGARLMAQAPAPQANALRSLDDFRVNQFQAPLTERESAYALAASIAGRPITAPPEPSVFDSARSDISTMVHAIPHLPGGMVSEVGKVWDIAGSPEWRQFEAASGMEKVGAFFNLPGIRLIPGAFNLSNMRPGGPGLIEGAKQHPVISILDVAPYASKAAKATPVFKAVEAASPVGTRLPPIRTVLRNWHPGKATEEFIQTRTFDVPQSALNSLSPEARAAGGFDAFTPTRTETIITPNAYGRFRDSAKKSLYGHAKWLESMFGRDARNAVQAHNRFGADNFDMEGPSRKMYEGTSLGTTEWEATAADLMQRTEALYKKYEDFTEDNYARTFAAGESGKLDDLLPREREYLDEITALSDELKSSVLADPNQRFWAEYTFTLPDGRELTEVLPWDAVNGKGGLNAARARLDWEEMGARARDARDGKLDMGPGADPVDLLHADLVRALRSPMDVKRKRRLVNAQIEALEAAGADVAPIRERLKTTNMVGDGGGQTASQAKMRAGDFIRAGDDIEATTLPRTGATVHLAHSIVDDSMGVLGGIARRKNPPASVVRLHTLLSTGQWKKARKLLNNPDTIPAGIRDTGIDTGALYKAVDHLDRLNTQTDILLSGKSGRSKHFLEPHNDTSLLRARENLERLERAAAPARFDRILKDEIEGRLTAETRRVNTRNPNLAQFEQAIVGGDWMRAGLSEKVVNELVSDVQKNWKGLAAVLPADQQPIFIHHVSAEKALGDILNPRVGVIPKTPSSAKKRLMNTTPFVKNPTVALTHQAAELITYQTSRRFVDYAVSTYGLPEAELMARLSDGLPPELRGNMEAIKAEAKKQGWVKFNPKKLGDEKLVPSQFRQDEMWMPRAFNDTLTELLKEHRNKSFMKSAAVPMQVFRTSVLALSPRWHLYNIVGGAVMMTAMARNPIKTWSMLPKAWNIVKEEWKGGAGLGHMDINLPPSGKARLHEEWMQEANLSGLPVEQQATWLRNMQAGRTMRRWYDAAAKSRLARAPGKLVEKSYTANQFVDDLYRSMTYLSAQDDAWKAAMRRAKKQGIPEVAASGMARKEADMAGVRAAREVFQEWDNMTPGERTVLRFITPFYSWTRHILKVVSHFPADHPWRTSILANFAANEMEDMQSGLPQRFYELLFMGEPNEEGTQMMFNPGGMNPFRDVANYASLVGFFWGDGDLSAVTTQLNPAISTVLEGAGVDVFKGQADLYPDVEYDAATGSLKVKTQTGPLSFLGGFVPQAETLMNMAGFSAEFERMKRRDPVAAASMLVSGVGIPASFRERNLYREQMTAELRRLESQDQAKRDALKSGNYDLMDQYPGLRAMRQQIEALTPEQLAPFRPDPAMGQYGPRDLYGQMAQALIGKATGG